MNQEARTKNHDRLISIFKAAVEAVRPEVLFERTNAFMELRRASRGTEHISVIGAGKAAIPMAVAAEKALDHEIDAGLVVVPRGYRDALPSGRQLPTKIEIVESGHPIPTEEGAAAGRRMLDLVRTHGSDDLVVVLISGGASALLPTPMPRLSLEDVTHTTGLLLRSGATIREVNTVRKHLTAISGGRLAEVAYPARLICLIISDVAGDDPSFIGSGPCVPDETTLKDARDVLHDYDLWPEVSDAVAGHLRSAGLDGASETPDSESEAFEFVRTRVLGTNKDAVEGARQAAVEAGLNAVARPVLIEGEARHVGTAIARRVADEEPGTCTIWGGETTVTVHGNGTGGRNQELILAAAIEIERLGADISILSAGTDGIDGLTQAAGAWADGDTIARARAIGLDPLAALDNNDSGAFFEALGQQVVTGPTHTNVMDIIIANR